ncbi:MAG: cob(I)yrinic acid a,c-diamide adenosyltransferase [Erysipelotrichaceae bacterium]
MDGLIHLYCGFGKGKSTAAFGLVARHSFYGKKILVTQFLKNFKSGEVQYFSKDPNVTIIKTARVEGFFPFMDPELQTQTKQKEMALFQEVIAAAPAYSLLILDELIDAINLDIIPLDTVVTFLKNKPTHLEVVLTGRNPDDSLVALADYYTQFDALKHPFEQGIAARESIEY